MATLPLDCQVVLKAANTTSLHPEGLPLRLSSTPPFSFAGPGHPFPILLLLWHRPVFRSPSFPRGHFRLLHGSLPPLGENGEDARGRMEDGLRPRSLALPRSSTVIVLLVFFTLRCNDSWLRGWLLRPPDGRRLDFAFIRALFRDARSTQDIFFFVVTSLFVENLPMYRGRKMACMWFVEICYCCI